MRRFSRVTFPAVLLAAGFSFVSLPPVRAAMDRRLPPGDSLRAPGTAPERVHAAAARTPAAPAPSAAPAPAAEPLSETARPAEPAAAPAQAPRPRIAVKPQ